MSAALQQAINNMPHPSTILSHTPTECLYDMWNGKLVSYTAIPLVSNTNIPRQGDIIMGFYALSDTRFTLIFDDKMYKHTYLVKKGEFVPTLKGYPFPTICCPYSEIKIAECTGNVVSIQCWLNLSMRELLIELSKQDIKLVDNFWIKAGVFVSTGTDD